MNLNEKISQLCERDGLKKQDLAELLGVTPAYLSQMLGGRPPSNRVLLMVERLLNQIVLPDGLMRWAEEEAKAREMRSANEFVKYLVQRERDAKIITPPVPPRYSNSGGTEGVREKPTKEDRPKPTDRERK